MLVAGPTGYIGRFVTKELIDRGFNVTAISREKAGIKTFDLDQAQVDKWKAVARDTCWKDYADKSPSNAEFLKLIAR